MSDQTDFMSDHGNCIKPDYAGARAGVAVPQPYDFANDEPLDVAARFDKWVHTRYGGDIMNQFIRDAVGLRRQEFTSYSAWALVGHLRYHHDSKYGPENTEPYKISNNFIAHMARFAMERCDELEGFFNIKQMKDKT